MSSIVYWLLENQKSIKGGDIEFKYVFFWEKNTMQSIEFTQSAASSRIC